MEGSSESDQSLLRKIVLQNSVSKSWNEARFEWELESIFVEESACICNHFIMENCVIMNQQNYKELIVGNVCVQQFGRPDLIVSKAAFSSLRKLRRAPEKHVANGELLDIAMKLGVLSREDVCFYEDITTGRGARSHFDTLSDHFSQKKYNCRKRINEQIVSKFSKARIAVGKPKHRDNFDWSFIHEWE